ncbi:hypothetical protein A3Q56_07839, partial [Intoshia linei]
MNFNLSQNIKNKVDIINFSGSYSALKKKFLCQIIKIILPKIENEKNILTLSTEKDNELLSSVQKQNLNYLQDYQEKLLDSAEIVDSFEKSKKISDEINERLRELKIQETKVDLPKNVFKDLASLLAIVYKVIINLKKLDDLYLFTFDDINLLIEKRIRIFFGKTEYYNRRLGLSIRLSDIEKQNLKNLHFSNIHQTSHQWNEINDISLDQYLQHFQDYCNDLYTILYEMPESNLQITKMEQMKQTLMDFEVEIVKYLYSNIGVALKYEHQIIFALLLVVSINIKKYASCQEFESSKICINEWHLFLKLINSEIDASKDNLHDIPNVDKNQFLMQFIMKYEKMKLSHDTVLITQFNLFINNKKPYKYLMDLNEKSFQGIFYELTYFQMLILIMIFRKDKLLDSIILFCQLNLSFDILESVRINSINEIYEISDSKHPILFIEEKGIDLSTDLIEFAKRFRSSSSHLEIISIGAVNVNNIINNINKAEQMKGRWIFIQNSHLAPELLNNFTEIIKRYKKKNYKVDRNYRLWLSIKPHGKIPNELLSICYKIYIQQHKNFKYILNDTFLNCVNKETFNSNKSKDYKIKIYSICLTHSIFSCRNYLNNKNYNMYNLSKSDVTMSIQQICSNNLITNKIDDDSDWIKIRNIMSDVIYGTKVTSYLERKKIGYVIDEYTTKKIYTDTIINNLYHFIPVNIEKCSYSNIIQFISNLNCIDYHQLMNIETHSFQNKSINLTKKLLNLTLKITDVPEKNVINETNLKKKLQEIKFHFQKSINSQLIINSRQLQGYTKINMNDIYEIGFNWSNNPMYNNLCEFEIEKLRKKNILNFSLDQISNISKHSMFTFLKNQVNELENIYKNILTDCDDYTILLHESNELDSNKSIQKLKLCQTPKRWK